MLKDLETEEAMELSPKRGIKCHGKTFLNTATMDFKEINRNPDMLQHVMNNFQNPLSLN
jgi:hypothetical protein